DRKSTRLNSSHVKISYAVFCLKKKTLWLRWQLDQRIIASKAVPIEVHYESFGNYHEIYAHYLIVRSVKKETLCIYIRTTVGHISFYREIEEAIQGFSQACSYDT